MSRNVRQKHPHTPVKATKRRGSDTTSSTLNLSDDDEHGYSGVEDVSDEDDEDEEHVFAAEEEHIITNASRKRSAGTPRPREIVEEDEDADEEAEDDDDDVEDDDENDEDQDVVDENANWDGIASDHGGAAVEQPSSLLFDPGLPNVERHVRFTGVPDSDSDSTTSETSEDMQDFFPDIFVDQSTLDPAFRREIENDHDDDSSTSGFWDYHSSSQELMATVPEDDDLTPTPTPAPSGAPTEASTPTPPGEQQESDGYETDGDTTEEDIPEPLVRRKRRFPPPEPTSDSETEKPTPFRRGKPRVGRFNLDKSEKKPIAVLNPSTRKMMIFTPQRVSSFDLSPESFDVDFSRIEGLSPQELSALARRDLSAVSPILNSGYLMMGAMMSSNTFGDFMNMQPCGPAEAFFPTTSDQQVDEYSDESEFVPHDEEEKNLRLEDFITFHHDSSDEEDESGVEWNGELASSPTRPTTAASGASAATDASAASVHPLLSHFDNNSNAVSAFRRNQIHQQLILSDKASQESLAFGSPYHYGTLRGIKSGSLETVTAPITPARRQKRSHTVSVHGFELQGSPQQKRKASSSFTDSLHKKQRSISDMDLLQI